MKTIEEAIREKEEAAAYEEMCKQKQRVADIKDQLVRGYPQVAEGCEHLKGIDRGGYASGNVVGISPMGLARPFVGAQEYPAPPQVTVLDRVNTLEVTVSNIENTLSKLAEHFQQEILNIKRILGVK